MCLFCRYVDPGKPIKTYKTILCCDIIFVFSAQIIAARVMITETERRSLP